MDTRETIGIVLMILGLIIAIFNPGGIMLSIIGIFVFGKYRFALFLLLIGIVGLFSPTGLGMGILCLLVGAALIFKNEYFPFGFSLTEGGKRKINPFSGEKHHNRVNDDEFLQQSANAYYQLINQSQLLDNTEQGQLMINVAKNLISAVENYLN